MFSLSLLCTQNCFMDEWGEYITIPFSGSTNTGPSDWVECVKPFAQAVKKHDCYRYREGSCKDYCFIMLCSSSGTIKICFAPSHPWNSAPSALCETTLIVNDSDSDRPYKNKKEAPPLSQPRGRTAAREAKAGGRRWRAGERAGLRRGSTTALRRVRSRRWWSL